jgi:hypothetical protein
MARRKPRKGEDLKRRPPQRESYDRVLIVCEGEKTEPNYFCELREYYKLNTANVDIIPADGSSPITVVHSAKVRQKHERKQGEQFDRIYCVFDKDEHTNYYDACKQASDNKIELATSIPCFEYWLLLHFKETMAPFAAGGGKTVAENAASALRKYLPGYVKASTGLFKTLLDRLDDAKKELN